MIMPSFLGDIAHIQQSPPEGVDILAMHNPMATFTTRGCPNSCTFCAVPRTEGNICELRDDEWEPKPFVADNNLLAASLKHFDNVINRYRKANLPFVDFNQGLDARLFDEYHARRIAELRNPIVRFACDNISSLSPVLNAISLARKSGLKDFRVYVLIGFEDTLDDAIYRLEALKSSDVKCLPQRYQPLYALKKNDYVHESGGWTDFHLRNLQLFYGRSRFFPKDLSYFDWLESPRYQDWIRGEKDDSGQLVLSL